MTDLARRALLPAGFADLLPPEAGHESAVIERLMALVGAHGYARVQPPLVEFETSLLEGSGAAMTPHSFRLMDPLSQRMLALRADMTLQVARIAAVRLASAPRPLRLSYAGQVVRVRGDALRSARQFGQIGCELIGAGEGDADVEVVRLAADSLQAIGVARLSVDLSSPELAAAIVDDAGLDTAARARLREALDRKDAAAVARHGGAAASTLAALLAASGPAPAALAAAVQLPLPAASRAACERLGAVARALEKANPGLNVTVDLIENRGFEYHTGLCFTLFATGLRGELGRGGRYLAGGDFAARAEPATGFTLYADTILRALPEPAAPRRVYVPRERAEDAARLREGGWITVAGLAPAADPRAEARRLGCTHALPPGASEPVEA